MTIKLTEQNIPETVAEVAAVLRVGKLVVLPTDTLYGLVGLFDNRQAVEQIYQLKGRDSDKRLLALVNSLAMVEKICQIKNENLMSKWPGPLTIIYAAKDGHPYGWDTQAVRHGKSDFIDKLLDELQQPLFAPSANPQGKTPTKNIEEAISYFGSSVPLYVDGDELNGEPSTIVDGSQEEIKILRQGAMMLDL